MSFIMKLLGYYSCTGTKVSSAATNAVRSAHGKVTNHHFGSHSAEGHVELAHVVSKPQIPQESSSRDLHRRADNTSQSLCNPQGRKGTAGRACVGRVLTAEGGLGSWIKKQMVSLPPILILRHFCGF